MLDVGHVGPNPSMNAFLNQGQEFGRLMGREIEGESINFLGVFM